MLQNSSSLPLVSVVIPSFNRANFLVPTIESVLQQDYPHIECIVVDGGSTDDTSEILRRYDGRLQWISEPDQGPSDAINKGWRMSNGEILTWLNADDLWAPKAVSKAVAHFQEHPEVDVVYGDCGIINQHGSHTGTVHVREWDLEYAVEYCDHIIFQAASFMRRSILERVGCLYPKLCHDHELWLRISLAGGKMQHIPILLAYARDHAENLGYRPEIVIPLKVGIAEQFFASPELPPRLLRLRKRAISNAYLRGIDYVFLGGFQWQRDLPTFFHLLYMAIRSDPSNISRAVKYLFTLKLLPKILRLCLTDKGYEWLRSTRRRWFGRSLPGDLREERNVGRP